MIEVLDYIPQLEEALSECLRILKPASSLILSFGNQSSLKAKLRELRGKTYMHSYSNVMQCLLKLGFKIEAKKGYNWLPFGRMSQSRMAHFWGDREDFRFAKNSQFKPLGILHAVKSS
jgi:ubiquinone/menaquinone biosynthesis C-methylase UbiE